MGYSGYMEYICPNGHYWTEDNSLYITQKRVCPHCEAKPSYYHEVDVTNGHGQYNEYKKAHEPAKYFDAEAPKIELPFEDKWLTDHYGNKYAVKVLRYKPDHPEWTAS